MRSERRNIDDRRILYVMTDVISTRFLRGQLSYLVDCGFDVHLACGGGAAVEEFARSEGVTAHPVDLVRAPRPFADLRGLFQLMRLMVRLRPTIVNASTPKAGLLGMIAAFLTRRAVRVYVVRGLRFENMVGPSRRVFELLERLSILCANRVIFESRSLRRVAEKCGVIRAGTGTLLQSGSVTGLDVGRFASLADRAAARDSLGIPGDVPVLGFVGRLTRDKGIDDLVRSFDMVRVDLPSVRLAIAGDLDASDPIDESVLARISGGDEGIAWLGWLDDPRVFLRAIDLLVFPSYREGLPITPLEAQASRTPVVGYAATGTVDAVRDGETGVLVPVGDSNALAIVITDLLADSERRRSMGAAGRRWVSDQFRQDRIWGELAGRYAEWVG